MLIRDDEDSMSGMMSLYYSRLKNDPSKTARADLRLRE